MRTPATGRWYRRSAAPDQPARPARIAGVKRSTAIGHLEETGEVSSEQLRFRGTDIGWPVEELWVTGDLLGLADTVHAGSVVLVLDVPPGEASWLAINPAGEWAGEQLRLRKRPCSGPTGHLGGRCETTSIAGLPGTGRPRPDSRAPSSTHFGQDASTASTSWSPPRASSPASCRCSCPSPAHTYGPCPSGTGIGTGDGSTRASTNPPRTTCGGPAASGLQDARRARRARDLTASAATRPLTRRRRHPAHAKPRASNRPTERRAHTATNAVITLEDQHSAAH
jgi:hypothetical protein